MKRFVGCWILFFIVFFFVSFIKHSECLSSDNKITLPKTGQTTKVADGDDGDLQKGVAWPEERFTVGSDDEGDCITDNLTGLMWAKNGNLPDEAKIWQDALEYVKNTTNSSPSLCRYTDWRLPNVNELASLINYGFNDGALCNNSPCDNLADWLNSSSFENVKNNNYWTSTTSASGSGNAWLVNMSDGVLTAGSKSDVNYVWAVRSILNDFTLTITKSGTGTGTVTSEPSGINYGSTCSKSFKENKNVTLTASAGDGSTFAGWSGSGCSGTGSCTVTMNSEKSVTATFNQNSTPPPPPLTCTYSISPQSQDFTYQGGSGTVRVTKNEIYCEQDNWTANTSESWISIISGSSGSGNGTFGYTVSENKTNSSRTGTITVAGNTFKVKQERATGKIISVNPTSINFGSLREGTKVTRQVTITNIGTETFYISGISITGTDVSKFAESNQCITLTAGSSCVVKVDYYANKRGDRAKHTGTLLIKSNATNNPNSEC